MPRTLVDGVEADALPVTDRGLQYGDGLFETIAIREGSPCLWQAHFERLARGADRLGIPCPSSDLLLSECRRLAHGEQAAVVKIMLTRGSGGRGYRPPEAPTPTRILSLYPWPDYPSSWREQGVAVTFCRTPMGENPTLAGLKHLNRLEQVLARSELRDPSIPEGLMQDGSGRVIGGTMCNLFLVRDGGLLTPRIDRCGIAGTVRDRLLRMAGAFGIEAAETDIDRADIDAAEALFLTNALIGVWPVRRVESKTISSNRLPAELIAAVREAILIPEGGRRN
jgi:4-amino-4-deoxychorismate lyase